VYDVVVKTFTFAISSSDEFLVDNDSRRALKADLFRYDVVYK